MTRRLLGTLLLLGALAGCGSDEPPPASAQPEHDAAAAEHWSYDDPDDWPDTCASGEQQSPVDLADVAEEDLADPMLAYGPTHARELNNGHTVQSVFDPGNTLVLDGTSYTLLQAHVHEPSEHTVDGRTADAEVHLVHQDADGNLAVLGVLVDEGAANPALDPLLDAMPAHEGDEVDLPEPVDPTVFLPASLATFRYDGSLTTPPCTEGVRWLVLEETVTWSAEQLAAFGDLYDGSARPVQPLNDREPVLDATG